MDARLATFVKPLQQRNIVDYTFVSAFAILIYDYILTLHLEIKYIWFSRWKYTKVLFLLIRYMTFISVICIYEQKLALNISEDVCKVIWPLASWLVTYRTIFAEIMLCIRTWALWNRHNVVGTVLAIVMLASTAVLSFLNYRLSHSYRFAPPPYPGFRGCLVTGADNISLATQYITVFAIETLTFALVVVSAFRFYRAGLKSELSFIIHRDGILFNLYLLLITGSNVVIALVAPIDLMFLLVALEDVLHSVFTTSVVLNIRSVANKDQETELHTSYIETRLRFAPGLAEHPLDG